MKKGFLWGVAMAAHQVEGGLHQTSQGLHVSHVLTGGHQNQQRLICPNLDKKHYFPNHEAIDFYNRYEEDIALLAEMGINTLRTSIAWSRLFPTGLEKAPDPDGLAFYRKVFSTLIKYGIEPVVTLSHFEIPLHLAVEEGGWSKREMIGRFLTFAQASLDAFQDQVTYWLTFNEINNQSNVANDLYGWTNSGVRFSQFSNPKEAMYQAAHYQFVAAAHLVTYAHQTYPHLKIGAMLAAEAFYPYSAHPKDVMTAVKAMNQMLFFSDVQMRGTYPPYVEKEFQKEGFQLDITNEDLSILQSGTSDF